MHDLRRPHYKPVDKDWVYSSIRDRLPELNLGAIALKGYIEETEYCICNYINRGYVPEPLKFVMLNLTIDLLKAQALGGVIEDDKLADVGVGSLASVKDGDSELKFATSKVNAGVHVADVDSLLFNYKSQLDKYRLIKW